MEEEQVITVRIHKVDEQFSVTIDAGEGIVLDEDYYKPKSVGEVVNLIEVWLNNFYG